MSLLGSGSRVGERRSSDTLHAQLPAVTLYPVFRDGAPFGGWRDGQNCSFLKHSSAPGSMSALEILRQDRRHQGLRWLEASISLTMRSRSIRMRCSLVAPLTMIPSQSGFASAIFIRATASTSALKAWGNRWTKMARSAKARSIFLPSGVLAVVSFSSHRPTYFVVRVLAAAFTVTGRPASDPCCSTGPRNTVKLGVRLFTLSQSSCSPLA